MTLDTMFRPLPDDDASPHPVTAGDEWHPVVPVPADAPALTRSTILKSAKPGYAITAGWRYLDPTGALLGCVVRYDEITDIVDPDKDIAPFTFCEGPGESGNGARRAGVHPAPSTDWTVSRSS